MSIELRRPFMLANTLTREVEPFVPGDPSRVTFYSCGPTVYDDAHIGNFRSFLAADLLRRWLESPLCTLTRADGSLHAGPRRVVHVMNITDVGHMTDDGAADGGGDDKMAQAGRRLLEAKKAGQIPAGVEVDPSDPRAVASFFAGRFSEDAARLGLRVAIEADAASGGDATLMPRASESVDGMRLVIARLLDRDLAYTAGEPGQRAVYFDESRWPAFGRLSGNRVEALRSGAGGRVSEEHQRAKRNAGDFLLWREDRRHLMRWPAPEHAACAGWDEGYPGWHIECTAMSLSRLVDGGLEAAGRGDGLSGVIDLHSGGEDNIFPHHECEIAQSCGYTGCERFARHWFHARHLFVEGAKMSKSTGNFYTARQLFDRGHEPSAVRLELVKAHYRSNADFRMQGLEDAARQVERWRSFVERGASRPGDAGQPALLAREAFVAAMSDDLNIAGALGAINGWIGQVPEPTAGDAAVLRELDAVVGVLDLPRLERTESEIGVWLPGTTPSAEVERLLVERREARQRKDFAAADRIRDELAQRGLAIKDAPGGRVEVGPA